MAGNDYMADDWPHNSSQQAASSSSNPFTMQHPRKHRLSDAATFAAGAGDSQDSLFVPDVPKRRRQELDNYGTVEDVDESVPLKPGLATKAQLQMLARFQQRGSNTGKQPIQAVSGRLNGREDHSRADYRQLAKSSDEEEPDFEDGDDLGEVDHQNAGARSPSADVVVANKKAKKPAVRLPRNAREAFEAQKIKNASQIKTAGRAPGPSGYTAVRDEANTTMFNLLNSDPIMERHGDAYANANGDEPNITATTKRGQFAAILQSLSDPADKKTARADKKRIDDAAKSFGYKRVQVVNGKWQLKGFKTPWYHHQLLGVEWMTIRELRDDDGTGNGGILADDMGLGKTLQALGVVVANPRADHHAGPGTGGTLIVVPSSILEQWRDEVKRHTDLPVVVYKPKSDHEDWVLESAGIVLTTYDTLQRQYPWPNSEVRDSKEYKENVKAWWDMATARFGPLHKRRWWRIILDEARE